MDIKEVRSLLKLFEGSAIHELEVQSGDQRVRFVRTSPRAAAPAPCGERPPAPAPAPFTPGGNGKARPDQEEGVIVRSPFVGTFYRAMAPGAPPFTDVGALVQPGQVLCIIEAMKLMNEIECEVGGRVAEIFVQNAQPVEFDHPLFRIMPV
ncbi:MAG: acetyl-CoA carboxylase biotin carboxyl carrier protein [Deltaproteobacteria bacterium]|nr:acetyl-CoA carboxylase biotin carboxyl carrier protein [Deltaproteobacteria bacterium]